MSDHFSGLTALSVAVVEAAHAVGVVVDEGVVQIFVGRVGAEGVAAVRIVGVRAVQERQGDEVAPSLVQAGGLLERQARAVADQAIRDAVRQLVDHRFGVKGEVAIHDRAGAADQLHAGRHAVRRRREARDDGGGVLNVGKHRIAAEPHATEAGRLEAARGFVEAELEHLVGYQLAT